MNDSLVRAVIAVWLGVVGSLAAQVRQPLFGSVLRANGKPLPDATVTLVESDADMAGLSPIDVVQVTTDRRGRFVASVLRGVRYAAFAVGPEIDGSALVAPSVGNLASGRRAVLQAAIVGTARPLQLQGLADWGDASDMHVRLTFRHCPGYYIALPIKNGSIDLPASGAIAYAYVHAKDGGRLTGVWIPPDGKGVTELTKCARYEVQVVDEQGQPVEGAEVSMQSADRGQAFLTVASYSYVRGDSAVTNAQGVARLRCEHWQHPVDKSPDTFVVVASKPGYCEGASGWAYHESFEGWSMKAREGKRIRIPLQATKPATGVEVPEMERTSQAFAGKRARLVAMAYATDTNKGQVMNYFMPRSYAFQFGEDGAWTLPPTAPTAANLILQLPPVEGRRVMMLSTMRPKLPSADLSQCELLSVQLLDVNGGPPSEASVMLVPRHATALDFRHVAPLVPDQAGRVEVLLQRGEWTLLAMDATSWISMELDEWSGDESLRLQLEPKPSRRVRVLDAAGQPIAGAKFEPDSFRSGFPGAFGLPKVLSQLGWNTFGSHVRRAGPDAKGEATLFFLPWPGTQPVAFAYSGSHKNRTEGAAILEGDDALVFQFQ